MVRFNVVFNDKNIRRKYARLVKRIGKANADEVRRSADFVKMRARQYVPVGKTHRLFDGIISVVRVNDDNVSEARVGYRVNPTPEKRFKDGRRFNLARWAAESAKALRHPWRNGKQARYLELAASEGRVKFTNGVVTRTRNIIRGK